MAPHNFLFAIVCRLAQEPLERAKGEEKSGEEGFRGRGMKGELKQGKKNLPPHQEPDTTGGAMNRTEIQQRARGASNNKSPFRKRRHRFVIFYTKLLRDPRIQPMAKLVFQAIKSYAGPDSVSWPSMATIAADLGISATTVKKAVQELAKWGLVSIVRRSIGGKKTSNAYTIDDDNFIKRKARGKHQKEIGRICPVSGAESAHKLDSVKEKGLIPFKLPDRKGTA